MTDFEATTAAVAVTTETTKHLFASVGKRLADQLERKAAAAAIKALAALEGYGSYLEETHDRVSTFKSFANPSKPVSLLDHFVETSLERKKNENFDQDDLIERASNGACIVISATAGYGKSMLMRYIALCMYNNPRGRIPLFIELRHLNRVKNPDLLAYIHATYNRLSVVQKADFDRNVDNGVFTFILDGFDELNHEIRPNIETQILELSKLKSQNSFVISGRPDDRFASWRRFEVFKIRPMSESQVITLIDRLEYDRGTKRRFVSKIRKGLYKSHTSFLSTPLLAILMLLTFEENANIPDKIHLFYEKAFETLFHKHDALKEQYDRQRKSGLQIDEFSKLFAVFCLNTYIKEKTEFTTSELTRFIKSSISYYGYKVDPSDFIFDLEEAVCLLHKEGLSFFFVHRSFQEYFTALFLANCPEETRDHFIDKVCTRYWDSVLPMLFDMAEDQIEPSWVKRNVTDYLEAVGSAKSKISPIFALFPELLIHSIDEKHLVVSFGSSPWSKFIAVMRRFYSDKFNDKASLVRMREFDEQLTYLPGFKEAERNARNEITVFGRKGKVFQITLEEKHLEWLGGVGLVDHANSIHDSIIRIRSELRKELDEKKDFLDKLFSS